MDWVQAVREEVPSPGQVQEQLQGASLPTSNVPFYNDYHDITLSNIIMITMILL